MATLRLAPREVAAQASPAHARVSYGTLGLLESGFPAGVAAHQAGCLSALSFWFPSRVRNGSCRTASKPYPTHTRTPAQLTTVWGPPSTRPNASPGTQAPTPARGSPAPGGRST